MSKFCIFCGNKPDNKTKEHIIPQWLIRLTDHENRKTIYGNKGENKISFPWMSYTFPACKSCNEKYSNLEGRVKTIIEDILNKNVLSQDNLIDLFDWLDKVRVGIWLGQSLLNGDILSPNFYISQRVGISDRLLLIYRSIEKDKGIFFTGTNSLSFIYSPSCFALTINDYTFFNYSSAFLLSKNMGFPYPESTELYPDGKIGVNKMHQGNLKIKRPLLDGKIIIPAIKIYQTILRSAGGNIVSFPIPDYFKDNTIKCSKQELISNLFIIDDYSRLIGFMDSNHKLEINITNEFPKEILKANIALMVFKHQKYEIERAIKSFDYLPEHSRQKQLDLYNSILAENSMFIEDIEKQLEI